MKATKERAAEWFEKMHPPGPAARELYRMAAEALRARVRDEHYNQPLEEQYECTGGWKASDPKTRPFKSSSEMEDWEYHG